jgi:hypothetical protein
LHSFGHVFDEGPKGLREQVAVEWNNRWQIVWDRPRLWPSVGGACSLVWPALLPSVVARLLLVLGARTTSRFGHRTIWPPVPFRVDLLAGALAGAVDVVTIAHRRCTSLATRVAKALGTGHLLPLGFLAWSAADTLSGTSGAQKHNQRGTVTVQRVETATQLVCVEVFQDVGWGVAHDPNRTHGSLA